MEAKLNSSNILNEIESTTERQMNLELELMKTLGTLGEVNTGAADKGGNESHSALRELEKKIKLENDKYEELMIDLALLKKGGGSGPVTKTKDLCNNNNNHMPKVSDATGSSSDATLISGAIPVTTGAATLVGELSGTDLDIPSSPSFTFNHLNRRDHYDPTSRVSAAAAAMARHHMFPITDFKSGDETSTFNSLMSSPSYEHVLGGAMYGDTEMPYLSTMTGAHPRIPPSLATLTSDLMEQDYSIDTTTESDLDNPVDMLEIPGKGRCFVYLARYSYDPFVQSLNDNPEFELPLTSGDYVLIWSTVDEDGFYSGELLDGRRGIVPSNLVEKLTGEDLLEFHRSALMLEPPASVMDEHVTTAPLNLPMEEDYIAPDTTTPEVETPWLYGDTAHLYNATFMSPEDDYYTTDARTGMSHHNVDDLPGEHLLSSSVPAPRHLTLERQLNKSILISWSPPEGMAHHIEMYHVYVDGFLRTTVKATDKTKALVEGVDNARPHRISVRSVLTNRKTSKDAACTMIIGKDAPLGPSCVKASNVTHSSALITWLPSNSNFQHTISINNVEVRTVKPGTFRHAITGLTPNTYYKVTIRAKNIKASPNTDERILRRQLEKLSAHTEFRTLNKALPDPPMDVRVDGGPQDGTILVTWIPVPHEQANRLAPVTGYAVFADGKRVTDVDSPTSDHALIDLGCIGNFNPKLITVRSKSREVLSTDSTAISLHSSKMSRKLRSAQDNRYRHQNHLAHQRGAYPRRPTRSMRDPLGQVIIDQEDEDLSDKEMYARNVPAIEITRDSPDEFDQYTDEDYLPRRGDHYGRGGGMRRPQRQGMGKENSRIFVALFDYDPPTMSPNPEACDDELDFREGQLIKIIGEKDADGFYLGECQGKRGYVPCNMVSEVQVDDDRLLHDTHLKDDSRRAKTSRFINRDRWNDSFAKSTPVRRMIALYDYDPQELSPNVDSEVELKFQTGDLIDVYGEMDDDGFFLAELRGMRGLVPSNFLTEAPHSVADKGAMGLSGASGPPPPPRSDAGAQHTLKSKFDQKKPAEQPQKPSLTQSIFQSIGGGAKKQQQQQQQQQQHEEAVRMAAATTPVVSAYQPPHSMAAMPPTSQPATSKHIDLDKIPGLDDFDDVPAITPTYTQPKLPPHSQAGGLGARTPAGTRPGQQQQQQEEGGLLGGLTSGLSGLIGGAASGVSGKLGDAAGAAAGAGGGLLSSGKGLFKKFGF